MCRQLIGRFVEKWTFGGISEFGVGKESGGCVSSSLNLDKKNSSKLLVYVCSDDNNQDRSVTVILPANNNFENLSSITC